MVSAFTVALTTVLDCVEPGTLASNLYCLPLSASPRAGVVYEAVVAPGMFVKVVLPLGAVCHWRTTLVP